MRVNEFSSFKKSFFFLGYIMFLVFLEMNLTIILGAVLGFPMCLCTISSMFDDTVVGQFFENLRHLIFNFSISFLLWHWYIVDFQVFLASTNLF